MEETDIRGFEGKRLPMRPEVVVIDVSFISFEARAAGRAVAGGGADHLRPLIKPQFEAHESIPARHHPQCDGHQEV